MGLGFELPIDSGSIYKGSYPSGTYDIHESDKRCVRCLVLSLIRVSSEKKGLCDSEDARAQQGCGRAGVRRPVGGLRIHSERWSYPDPHKRP
jgi:hypothetical protein